MEHNDFKKNELLNSIAFYPNNKLPTLQSISKTADRLCNPGRVRHLLSQGVTGNDVSGVLKVLTAINYVHQMTHLDTTQGTLGLK